MITNEMIKLENGVKVPKLALGVWMIPEKETEAAVKSAIAMGYRHADTSRPSLVAIKNDFNNCWCYQNKAYRRCCCSCWCHVDRRRNPVSRRALSTSSFSWSNSF